MRIAIDHQIFTIQEYGGVSRYFCSLARQLAGIEGVEVSIIAPFYINAYLKNLPRGVVSGIKIPRIPKTGELFQLGGLWLAHRTIGRLAPQIVHETYYTKNHAAPKNVRTVLTVYDMIHERFRSMFPPLDRTSELKRAAVLHADHVICISENTRHDLLDLLPISSDKVSVVYLGFDQFVLNSKYSNTKSLIKETPYLLYVGERGGYKNFKGLLQTYSSSNWLRQNFCVICFGGGPLNRDEHALINRLKISPNAIQHVTGGDDVLAGLYASASIFVYPSLYEGFGIPPLEAMSLSCPVACSNTSSIPEVTGVAAELFDPTDHTAMREAIERVLSSPDHASNLIAKGHERIKQFTWDKCAQATLDIYRKILQG